MARHKALTFAALAGVTGILAACSSQDVSTSSSDPPAVKRGAVIFAERCGGCHTFSKAGTQGGAYKIKDRERVDGPSFDARKETVDQALYAIRNGGFSGAIMPENIVTGPEAQAVAQFLAKYSGGKGESQATPPSEGPPKGGPTAPGG